MMSGRLGSSECCAGARPLIAVGAPGEEPHGMGGGARGCEEFLFRRFAVLVSEIYNLKVKQNVTRHWTESAGITIRHFFLALLP